MLKIYIRFFKFSSLVAPNASARIAFKLFCTPQIRKFRAREVEVLANAQIKDIPFDGSFIRQYQWGNGNKNALLIHGWESNAGSLGAFVPLLIKKGFTITAFDCPAHGASGGKQTTLFKNIQAANVVLSNMDSLDTIITHSFGSAVALMMLVKHPEIIVNKMLMVTTPDRLLTPFQDFFEVMQLKKNVQQKILNLVEKEYQIKISNVNASEVSKAANILNALLIHDPDDAILPYSGSENVARNMVNAQLIPMPNKGHYRILWDDEVIQQAENFI